MSPIEVFYRDCVAGLKRIVAHARGDVSLEDVRNEAWVMAEDLARAGKPLDLTSAEDQNSLIARLYIKLVKKLRTSVGFALRLDKDWDRADHEAGLGLAATLKAPSLSDPLLALQHLETESALEETRRKNYSQATAYAICLHQWADRILLANYLCITVETLRDRVKRWSAWVLHQPSLFDGIEFVALDFKPLPGITLLPDIGSYLEGEQLVWLF